MYHIFAALTAVVVKEESGVVTHLNLVAVPWAVVDVGCGEDIGFRGGVAGDDEVEAPFVAVVAQIGRPGAAGIVVLPVFQCETVEFLKLVVGIAYYFPVDKVGAPHYRASRREVHGGRYHIEIVAHAYYVGVRHVCIDYRVGKCRGRRGSGVCGGGGATEMEGEERGEGDEGFCQSLRNVCHDRM